MYMASTHSRPLLRGPLEQLAGLGVARHRFVMAIRQMFLTTRTFKLARHPRSLGGCLVRDPKPLARLRQPATLDVALAVAGSPAFPFSTDSANLPALRTVFSVTPCSFASRSAVFADW